MQIKCSNDILSAGDKRKQKAILAEYSQLINKRTDVAIPFYKLDKDKFDRIWPPHELDREECIFWRKLLSEADLDIERLCSGQLTAECSVIFLNDVQYMKWSSIDYIESPGIYIKDPMVVDNYLYDYNYLFDYMMAYNIHLAETYYLSNRRATTEKFKSKDIDYFKSFIVSFLTIRSLFMKNERMIKELVFNYSSYLVGSWKVPFFLLHHVPEVKWNKIFENDEVVSGIEDILSGSSLGNVNVRLRRIRDEFLY